jgi:hypothetical protein
VKLARNPFLTKKMSFYDDRDLVPSQPEKNIHLMKQKHKPVPVLLTWRVPLPANKPGIDEDAVD